MTGDVTSFPDNTVLSVKFRNLEEDRVAIDVRMKRFLITLRQSELSIDEKWNWFIKLCSLNLLPISKWDESLIEILDPTNRLCLFDNFNIEKREIVTYEDMYNTLLEIIDDDGELDTTNSWATKITQKHIDDWRTAVINGDFSGFVYYW